MRQVYNYPRKPSFLVESLRRLALARSRHALGEGHGVGDRAGNEAETFHSAAWFARESDDDRKIDNRSETARQNRVWRDFHRLDPHRFTKAGNFHAHDGADRFWRDIARADPGPASGQNQATALFGKRADRFLDPHCIIGNEGFGKNLPACLSCSLFQGRSAKIVIFTRTGAIGNRDDANLYLHLIAWSFRPSAHSRSPFFYQPLCTCRKS